MHHLPPVYISISSLTKARGQRAARKLMRSEGHSVMTAIPRIGQNRAAEASLGGYWHPTLHSDPSPLQTYSQGQQPICSEKLWVRSKVDQMLPTPENKGRI